MTLWVVAFLCLVTTIRSLSATDLETSESQHDQQVAILKQIRKVNDDGSYTYGYEAGDGSFKVESRDVLGNIKGTFGFVDATGEVKRVSYSSENGTGFKSTSVSPLQEQISVVQSRANRSATKKPIIVHSSGLETVSKPSVVQPIPKIRKTTTIPVGTTVSSSTVSSTSDHPLRPSFVRSSTSRPRFMINGQQRPMMLEAEAAADDEEEAEVEEDNSEEILVPKPTTTEKINTIRRIIFAKRPVSLNLPPITEEFEDKDTEAKIATGNALRRQLQDETTKSAPVVELDDDHSDVYGGSMSTSRPLFTTTSSARVATRSPSVRQERQKPIFSNRDNRDKYSKEAKTLEQDERNTAQQVQVQSTTRAPSDNKEYARQSTEPLYVRQQPEYVRDLPPNGILVQGPGNHLEDDPAYRQVPVGRLVLRPDLGRQPLYSGVTEANVHYYADSPPGAHEYEEAGLRIPISPAYQPRHRAHQRQLAYVPEGLVDPRRGYLRPVGHHLPPDEREYQGVAGDPYAYRGPIALPPEHPNPIAPPLSRRDFQYLLRRLLISQYGIQALNYPRAYLEDALYEQHPHQAYHPGYLHKGEIPYGAEGVPVGPLVGHGQGLAPLGPPVAPVGHHPPGGPPVGPAGHPPGPGAPVPLPHALPYPERIPLRRPLPPPPPYSRSLNPIYQREYEDYPDTRYAKRVYREKLYNPEMTEDGEEILPPQIREALLLRMLQLAISAERPVASPSTMYVSTTTPPSRYRKSGPVRSVQIIGEDLEEAKEARKKM